MSIYEVSAVLAARGVKHVIVDCSNRECVSTIDIGIEGEATALTINFRSSAERAKARREAKQYRMKNKSKLKQKRKKYELKMKHKKPNRERSLRQKLISKHYHHA